MTQTARWLRINLVLIILVIFVGIVGFAMGRVTVPLHNLQTENIGVLNPGTYKIKVSEKVYTINPADYEALRSQLDQLSTANQELQIAKSQNDINEQTIFDLKAENFKLKESNSQLESQLRTLASDLQQIKEYLPRIEGKVTSLTDEILAIKQAHVVQIEEKLEEPPKRTAIVSIFNHHTVLYKGFEYHTPGSHDPRSIIPILQQYGVSDSSGVWVEIDLTNAVVSPDKRKVMFEGPGGYVFFMTTSEYLGKPRMWTNGVVGTPTVWDDGWITHIDTNHDGISDLFTDQLSTFFWTTYKGVIIQHSDP